jgi:hypothetical protein
LSVLLGNHQALPIGGFLRSAVAFAASCVKLFRCPARANTSCGAGAAQRVGSIPQTQATAHCRPHP